MNTALIEPVFDIANKVGKVILNCRLDGLEITQKLNKTQLTQADIKAHKIMTQGLEELTPKIPVLSEESSHNHHFNSRNKWQSYWLIDPLDGTQNFIDNSDEFCINIAYITDHRPVFGLIYAPVLQTYFYAHKELGAFKQTRQQKTRLTHHVNHQPLRVTIGHYSDDNQLLQQHLKQLSDYQLHRIGSALKFAYIAQGKYDYYPKFGRCSEWDTAAGVCLLECAGGQVVDLNGQQLCYNATSSLESPTFFAYGQKTKI